nr:DUF2325 domain-containing protein [uncultured Roseateles sp.]
MCDDLKPSATLASPATLRLGGALNERLRAIPVMAESRGSRRHRLWDLPHSTHCPLMGVCLPMPALRRLLAKFTGAQARLDDYEVHVGAVAECARRGPVAEAIQRELDRRHLAALRRFAQAKTTEQLAGLWTEAQQGADIAGALWATLTHARCSDGLREQVCREIHMIQHQVGACNRADLQRLDEVLDENAVLTRQLAALQQRCTREMQVRAEQVEALQQGLIRARAEAMAKASALDAAQQDLQQLEALSPGLQNRAELARRLEEQVLRSQALERQRLDWQQQAERETQRAQGLSAQLQALSIPEELVSVAEPDLATLKNQSILCVGGRTASVPVYKCLIEGTGGRFLHHDGGEDHTAAQLESSLAAADLVICQTGCVSHGAYWRVKDHCKRTGKRCVFVDKPSASSLARCLKDIEA